jgi:hypothetical protein
MNYLDILFGFAALVAMFGSQVYLIKRLVAFTKEATSIQGSAVRWLSFGIGAVIGGLFLWPWIELNPGYPLSVYVLNGTLFLLMAGLTASGDYDLGTEKDAIKSGVLGNRTPEK